MKFYRSIWIEEKGFPPDLYSAIAQIKPECRRADHFHMECQPGDNDAAAVAEFIVARCQERQLKRTARGEDGTYGYDVVRHYEANDLKAAPLLLLETQKRVFRDTKERDSSGRLLLPAPQARPTIKIASIFFTDWFVVSDEVRRVLEVGTFAGLVFVETVMKGKSVHAAETPFWELESNVTLPKMVNALRNEYSTIPSYMIVDPPYRYGEPHYRQSELAKLGEFDVARTLEPFGRGPLMLVTQRFFQHCLKHKVLLDVRPVRIDPD